MRYVSCEKLLESREKALEEKYKAKCSFRTYAIDLIEEIEKDVNSTFDTEHITTIQNKLEEVQMNLLHLKSSVWSL